MSPGRTPVAATMLILLALVGGFVARTIEARRAHRARAQILTSIGSALMHQGDDDVAYRLLREAYDLRRRELGPDDPKVAETAVELGVLRQRYDLAEGERYLREAVRIRERRLGPNDLWLANSLADLADVRRRQRAFVDAEQLLLRSVAIREKALSANDPTLAASLNTWRSSSACAVPTANTRRGCGSIWRRRWWNRIGWPRRRNCSCARCRNSSMRPICGASMRREWRCSGAPGTNFRDLFAIMPRRRSGSSPSA
jgi:tetratricopeptide (TPR) repeat protein